MTSIKLLYRLDKSIRVCTSSSQGLPLSSAFYNSRTCPQTFQKSYTLFSTAPRTIFRTRHHRRRHSCCDHLRRINTYISNKRNNVFRPTAAQENKQFDWTWWASSLSYMPPFIPTRSGTEPQLVPPPSRPSNNMFFIFIFFCFMLFKPSPSVFIPILIFKKN